VQNKDVPQLIAHLEAQGSLLSMKVLGFHPRSSAYGGKRGIIRVFSQASRRRLMRFMARLKTRKIRATFITLTFSGVHDNVYAKKALKRFAMRARRAFKGISGIWRMEFQARGSIHFHLLMFNMPFWAQKKLQAVWEACTGENRSICDIRLVHGARSVMAYVSKYIAKADNRTEIPSLDDVAYQHAPREDLAGRFWGYINKELLPLGEAVIGVLTERQTIKSLSSFAWAILGSENPYNSLSFHLFCENARWLCERAIEEGGCWMDEWEFTVTDHKVHPPKYNTYSGHISDDELNTKEVLALGRKFKGERSELVQPLTSDWLKRASLSFVVRMKQDFANSGILVSIVPHSKGQDHAVI
jgi:hypothetical protein